MSDVPNDFGKAKSDSMRVIEDVQFKIKLAEAKRDGLSPLKMAEKLIGTGDNVQSLGKTIKIISAFQHFYGYIPNRTDVTTWKAGEGYAAIIQGYIEHPSADEFAKFHDSAETLNDVLTFLLEKENIPMNVFLSYVPRLDAEWFLFNLREQSIRGWVAIAGNKDEFEAERDRVMAVIDTTTKKVEAAEALHETLMKD